MKKLLLNLFFVSILCIGVACGDNTQDRTEENKAPVSADNPRAPTVSPDKPTTDVGAGLEDSVQQQQRKR